MNDLHFSNIIFLLINSVWFVLGIIYGLKIWKEKGFFSKWWDEISIKEKIITFQIAFNFYLIVSFVYSIKNKVWKEHGFFSLWWFKIDKKERRITAFFFWGLFICLIFIFIFLGALGGLGGSNTRRANNNDNATYINGSTDAMNGASPLHPENPQYMQGYNEYKNNH